MFQAFKILFLSTSLSLCFISLALAGDEAVLRKLTDLTKPTEEVILRDYFQSDGKKAEAFVLRVGFRRLEETLDVDFLAQLILATHSPKLDFAEAKVLTIGMSDIHGSQRGNILNALAIAKFLEIEKEITHVASEKKADYLERLHQLRNKLGLILTILKFKYETSLLSELAFHFKRVRGLADDLIRAASPMETEEDAPEVFFEKLKEAPSPSTVPPRFVPPTLTLQYNSPQLILEFYEETNTGTLFIPASMENQFRDKDAWAVISKWKKFAEKNKGGWYQPLAFLNAFVFRRLDEHPPAGKAFHFRYRPQPNSGILFSMTVGTEVNGQSFEELLLARARLKGTHSSACRAFLELVKSGSSSR